MSQCATCHAGCCRTYVVPLTGADILQIMADQRLSFWDFACRWADPQGTIALKYAPHFYFRDAPQVPFVIALIQDSSRVFPQTTRCRFLVEGDPTREHPLGISQCGIYESRPSACRVFPTKFDRAGELAVLCDVPSQGNAGNDPVYGLCPKPWMPRDLDPIRQVQDLVVAKFEMKFFFKLAGSWNARPGDWRLFPDF
ncbi:MAG: YkgJ family cysteine cluster protein, partial [Planctomycetia bacterium]|nr:YkgJ family cysteine cluster protein [Planctomycetia bacterium]